MENLSELEIWIIMLGAIALAVGACELYRSWGKWHEEENDSRWD